MKILFLGNCHHKNKEGYSLLFKYLKYTVTTNIYDIDNCDYIISPSHPIDTSKYPNKKFIFGPQLSLYPDNRLYQINNIYKNSVYIQPSSWVIKFWKYYSYFNEFQKSSVSIPVKPFFLPVNIDKFKPVNNKKKEKVFIYFKRRKPEELDYLKKFLNNKNIEYKVFDYVKKYNEKDYLEYLQNSKYGIILDANESQGFAIEEALSCDVPLIVWNVTSIEQQEGSNWRKEEGSNIQDIPATSIPYWDYNCGEVFYKKEEFEEKYNEFISKLDIYKPRTFVLENLSVEKCAENFNNLFK